MAKTTGPATIPSTPNTSKPPSTEKNITNSLSLTRSPTSFGLKKLSTELITNAPNAPRIVAFPQWPVSRRYPAPGIHTLAVPNKEIG
jgi:hypothetical protein